MVGYINIGESGGGFHSLHVVGRVIIVIFIASSSGLGELEEGGNEKHAATVDATAGDGVEGETSGCRKWMGGVLEEHGGDV